MSSQRIQTTATLIAASKEAVSALAGWHRDWRDDRNGVLRRLAQFPDDLRASSS